MYCNTRIPALLLLAILAALSPASPLLVVNPSARQPGGKWAPTGSPSHARAGAASAEVVGINGSSTPAGQNVLDVYGKLPLAFAPNGGQMDAHVRFSAQAGGATFYFTQKEAVFAFTKGSPGQASRVVLGLVFLGANPETTIEGQGLGTGRVNYLIGNDPSGWRTGLPTYGQVVYRDLWPGVDMVFRGDANRLKYEFILRPGAKVDDIRLAYRGAERLSIDKAGQLLIRTPMGTLEDARPASYQEVGGTRVPIESRFFIHPDTRDATAYGFAVGDYDPRQPLVIDPGLLYSTYLGGTNSDIGARIAVDAMGNAFVTGETDSTNFPTTVGVVDTSHNGNFDVFVTKLNAAGSARVYSTYLGGTAADRGFAIAIDTVGNAYITGETGSNPFPTTAGAFDTSYNGNIDAFVTKLDPTGSMLLYSTYLGGSNADRGRGIAFDAGSIYVTGDTLSGGAIAFPTTAEAFDTSYNGQGDAFVTKLNPTPSVPVPLPLIYSTYLGGAQTDVGAGIAVDATGSAHVTGRTNSDLFPTTPGVFDTTQSGDEAFVTKLDAAGSALVYSTLLGGGNADRGFGIALDTAGNAYVTGETNSTGANPFPTSAGAFDTSLNGNFDAFVTKLNATGSAPLYSTYLGGSNIDGGFGITVDTMGSAYVTGVTNSGGSDPFPTTAGAFDTTYNSSGDAFVTKLNADGSALAYSTYLGGSNADMGHSIFVDAPDSVYVTGATNSGGSNPFPTTAGAFDTTYNTDGDAFVTKLHTVAAAGACTTALDCNDGNVCTTDTCVAGSCVNAANTASCNDGDACTQTDTCQSGVCTGTNPVVCTASDQCHDAGVCNPASGTCSNPAKADGAACSDGDACTQTDTCQSGVCTGTNPVVCTASDQCHDAGVCNPASGACSNPNAPAGAPCGDLSDTECTNPDTCNGAGVCQTNDAASGTACGDAGSACTNQDTCNGSGACTDNGFVASGTACGDPSDTECTNPDTCNGSGSCQANDAVSGTACGDAGSACTNQDTCNGSGACTDNGSQPDGTACTEDGEVCTDDVCQAGECAHPPKAAGTACGSSSETQCDNADTCDGDGHCQENPKSDGTACDEGDLCTNPDTCEAGECRAGPSVGCKVTGAGGLTRAGDKVNFGFNVQSASAPKGQLEYHKHWEKTTYYSVRIDSLAITAIGSCSANPGISGKRATITGTIRKKKGGGDYSFTLKMEDCGEPGRSDFFDLLIGDGESRAGPLDKGNIQVH